MMPRLLLKQEWYEPLQPNAVLDTAYEALLLESAAVLFTGFVPVAVHYRVTSTAGHASPHLALIDKAYRSWWLVLLETGQAPAADYVRQQTEVLRSARYGPDFAGLLAGRSAEIAFEAVRSLVAREAPGVFLLLAHPPGPANFDPAVRIGIAEIFRSSGGADILRINGQHPEPPEDRVGTCTRNRHVAPNLLRAVLDPGVDYTIPPRCEIELGGAVSMWTVRTQASAIYLVPEGSIALPVDQEIFLLVRGDGGRLRLDPQSKQHKIGEDP